MQQKAVGVVVDGLDSVEVEEVEAAFDVDQSFVIVYDHKKFII